MIIDQLFFVSRHGYNPNSNIVRDKKRKVATEEELHLSVYLRNAPLILLLILPRIRPARRLFLQACADADAAALPCRRGSSSVQRLCTRRCHCVRDPQQLPQLEPEPLSRRRRRAIAIYRHQAWRADQAMQE